MQIRTDDLLITDQDFERLVMLVHQWGDNAAGLEEELGRAKVIPQREAPRDLVTMNSSICFVDEATDRETKMTLVYPKDADVTAMKVSVLAPVGTALIGLRLGQSINWPMPNGTPRRMKVVSIPYQPEAEGNWEL